MPAVCLSAGSTIQTTVMAKKPNIPELAVSRSEGEPRAHHLIVIRGLSAEEYEKYVASRKRVMRFVNDYLKFTHPRADIKHACQERFYGGDLSRSPRSNLPRQR
jgi:hypothetical protein